MVEFILEKEIEKIIPLHEIIFEEKFCVEEFIKRKEDCISEIYLIMHAQKIVGYSILFSEKDKSKTHIWLAGIVPLYQGKGYYSKFLDFLIKDKSEKGFKKISLSSYNNRKNMLCLVIRKDFKIIGTTFGKYGDNIKILFKKKLD